jgi:hypothetical protein
MAQSPRGRSGSGRTAETRDSSERDEHSRLITRTAVLASALEIIDRDGVEGLSMRRLGEAVGRDPMVLDAVDGAIGYAAFLASIMELKVNLPDAGGQVHEWTIKNLIERASSRRTAKLLSTRCLHRVVQLLSRCWAPDRRVRRRPGPRR